MLYIAAIFFGLLALSILILPTLILRRLERKMTPDEIIASRAAVTEEVRLW